MGCSWISVASLAVLIFASFMENMRAISQSSSIVTKQDKTTKGNMQSQTVSTIEQLATDNIVTTSVPVVTTSRNDQQYSTTSWRDKADLSETDNCTLSENTTLQAHCSTEETSSIKSVENYSERAVTYKDFSKYSHYKRLIDVSPYISTIPGFITNSFTIITAMRIKPTYTSEIYMIVLGCADLFTVISRFTLRMVVLNVKIILSAECKFLWYVLTVSQVYSNIILVSWTIERFIAVVFPTKLASWCSIRNTKITTALSLLFCIAITSPYILETDVVKVWNGRETVNVCHSSTFIYSVWVHVESVYYIYLPMSCVCICNLTILCRLNSMTNARISMASNKETIDKKANENRKMTILLLTIFGSLVFLHIPYATVMVFNYIYPDVTVLLQEYPHAFAKFLVYTACGYYVTEFQNSINFFLYCISGSKFRSPFKQMFNKHITIKNAETFSNICDSFNNILVFSFVKTHEKNVMNWNKGPRAFFYLSLQNSMSRVKNRFIKMNVKLIKVACRSRKKIFLVKTIFVNESLIW